MKLIYTLLCTSILLLTSCSGEGLNADGTPKTKSTKSVKVTVPDDICTLINKEMIQSHFDVQEADLEMELDAENYKQYATCGYKWEKENFEELKNIQLETMMAMSFPKDGQEKSTVSDILKLESPYSMVYVGKFKTYTDPKQAKSRFDQSHHVPTKEEMEHLKKEIDKNKEMTDEQKEMGQGLSGGIGANLKFQEVTGIGDAAYYDYLSKSVDVLLSDISFSVLIDSDKSLEENIDIAKLIATEVIKKITK